MGKVITVAFRLDADLVAKLDEFAAALARQNPGLQVTRTDAVRMLLVQALETATKGKRKGKP
jgi:hypothetical protein